MVYLKKENEEEGLKVERVHSESVAAFKENGWVEASHEEYCASLSPEQLEAYLATAAGKEETQEAGAAAAPAEATQAEEVQAAIAAGEYSDDVAEGEAGEIAPEAVVEAPEASLEAPAEEPAVESEAQE